MQLLATLMLSMMLLTTALLAQAVAMNDPRPGVQPGSVSDRVTVDYSQQRFVVRGR
jgi:hypothetical protein